ncbi:MAG: hypothetical protein IT362_01125 [Deltaproteobacteria bacterium]|nr:hypothetical protein [Deltaproteobacteria bacterium]
MYSSNVLKHSPFFIDAEPFELGSVESLEEILPESDHSEDIGTKIEALERKAYENGFCAGEKAGFEFGRKKAEVLFSGLDGIMNELSDFKQALYGRCEREMVGLCLSIAKKVIQRETAIKEDGVLECLRAALKSVVAGGEISIRVNPKDLSIVSSNRPELMRFCGGVKGMTFEADDAISRGGCVVSTNFGEIDATIDSAIAEIEEKLKDAYSGN